MIYTSLKSFYLLEHILYYDISIICSTPEEVLTMDIMSCIKQLIKDKNITAYTVCKRGGISQSTLSNIIKRGNEPSFSTLIKICKGLDISLVDLAKYLESSEHEELPEYLSCHELIKGYINLSKEQRLLVLELIKYMKNP